ncbi:MAG TPA: hypothetical protein VFO62_10385 [Candidatus Binatia bacterium]|nr:hypothetical protein [Candidatus Binatia bacterium]
MPTRVLNVHVTGLQGAPDHESVQLALDIKVGRSDGAAITDTLNPTLDLKNALGVYRTAIEMNLEVIEAAKDHMLSSQSIPTNGYAAVYVSGAYGLLSIL